MEQHHNEVMFKNLKWFLQALSQEADVQITLFDELDKQLETTAELMASGYSESAFYFKSQGGVTDFQRNSLMALANYFLSISGEKSVNLWEDEALFTSFQWQYVREQAKLLLGLFGWKIEKPNNSDQKTTYIFIK